MTDPNAPRWRPHRLLHRLPAHVINGCSVALGIALMHLLATALFGTAAGAWATSGAIYASLADVPDTVSRNWRKVITAGALGGLAVLGISALASHPLLRGMVVALVAFVGAMMLSWGPRAGPLAFVPILAMVFAMALPPAVTDPFVLLGWHLAGSAGYLAWSLCATALLQRRYGSLALAEALGDAANLLRLRGRMLSASDPAGSGLQAWVDEETQLADRLQAARDLLFAAADTEPAHRQSAMLLRAIDLRDVLLASLLDHERLGEDEPARQLKLWLGAHLEAAASALERVQFALQGIEPRASASPLPEPPGEDALRALAGSMPTGDPRRRLLPALVNRARHLQRDVQRIEALSRGADEELPLGRDQLLHFVSPEGWPLEALRRQASLASPVLRHALRSAAALATAYYLALALPWASHPQWLVLSVAVVLRGNLEQTLSRRNARVMGTVAGCLLLLAIQRIAPLSVQTAVFLLAVGLAHGFAIRFYLVTAMAATVMSLLQVHLADPSMPIPFAERLADTVLGALLAWGFSYVLPAWERRLLPLALSRALEGLKDYAEQALGPDAADALPQRLARRRAYDALTAVANALRRSGAEPARVQPPRAELARFLDQAQRLMAHLSMLRLMRMREEVVSAPAEAKARLAVALQRARQSLGTTLVVRPAAGAGAGDGGSQVDAWQQMPPVSPSEDLAAWVGWRLRVTAEAGREAGRAARAALALLRPASR